MQLVVTQKLGKLYLNLGLEQFKQCDYDKAKEWYQKALKISEQNPLITCCTRRLLLV